MATDEKTIEKGSIGMAHAKEIQFSHFWAEHGTRINFNLDQVESMMSACHDAEEPLFFHANKVLYKILWHSIDNYFKTHTKPQPPMSQAEELKYWRARAMKLEKEMKGTKGEPDKINKGDVLNVDEPSKGADVPPQDKTIPTPTKEDREQDKMSVTEIQEEIKADLKTKSTKGASNREEKFLKAEPKVIPKVDEAL